MSKIIRRRCAPANPDLEQTDLHPLLARVYAGRGVSAADDLDLSFDQLIPPARLQGAQAAAALLADAMGADSRMLIVGDFDADGATSTALAVSALRAMGAMHVDYLVPNRFEYGYGLTPEIVALAADRQPDLIVTVDNGISSLEGVAAARALGIATLVTDHHLAGRDLPDAEVIVNPNQPGCQFPSKHLAGVGVIFYVMLALRAELRERGWFDDHPAVNLAEYLDLVALGTVADVVPLDHNNRILVAQGLRRMRAGHARPGINALLAVASRAASSVVASDLGFAVGPRINAAGRLDDMSVGIECLLAPSLAEAQPLAAQLQQLNQDRRHIEQAMQESALSILASMDSNPSATAEEGASNPPAAITLYQGDWHQGVIGILASRVKDRLHRPTIVFADADELADGAADDGALAAAEIKGSARSIPGIHIRDILDAVATRHPGLITRFGGHAMAAGLTLPQSSYEAFSAAFVAEVERHMADVELQAVIESDGELSAQDFDLALAQELRFAGPWGQHFPEPVFDGRFTLLQQRLVGEKHLKMVVQPLGSGQAIDAIAFNVDVQQWPDERVRDVRLAYRLDVNEFRGRQTLQLMVEQIEL